MEYGSEKNPGTGPESDAVANLFVPAGYVVSAPIRRGQGDSQGEYIGDRLAQTCTICLHFPNDTLCHGCRPVAQKT